MLVGWHDVGKIVIMWGYRLSPILKAVNPTIRLFFEHRTSDALYTCSALYYFDEKIHPNVPPYLIGDKNGNTCITIRKYTKVSCNIKRFGGKKELRG